jgi:Mg2+ and Co2+ transporter CorA
MLSLILGIGAVVTGFFGMNFGRGFAEAVFEPMGQFPLLYHFAIVFVVLVCVGVLSFCFYVVSVNWNDYKDILNPHERKARQRSLRRDS